jgi:hypothetical protein
VYCVKGEFQFDTIKDTRLIRADGAEFGNLFLHSTFIGEVSIRGVAIKRELNCTARKFLNPQGRALTADPFSCESLYLNECFVAVGTVSL